MLWVFQGSWPLQQAGLRGAASPVGEDPSPAGLCMVLPTPIPAACCSGSREGDVGAPRACTSSREAPQLGDQWGLLWGSPCGKLGGSIRQKRRGSPSGVLPQPQRLLLSRLRLWVLGLGRSSPSWALAPPGKRPFSGHTHPLTRLVLRQKSPSCPRTTARPTAAPSGLSSASSCRSSSWAGSTSCASAWCVSATRGPPGPSRTSTSVGPPTCPSTSSRRAAPSTGPSQVRSRGSPEVGGCPGRGCSSDVA